MPVYLDEAPPRVDDRQAQAGPDLDRPRPGDVSPDAHRSAPPTESDRFERPWPAPERNWRDRWPFERSRFALVLVAAIVSLGAVVAFLTLSGAADDVGDLSADDRSTSVSTPSDSTANDTPATDGGDAHDSSPESDAGTPATRSSESATEDRTVADGAPGDRGGDVGPSDSSTPGASDRPAVVPGPPMPSTGSAGVPASPGSGGVGPGTGGTSPASPGTVRPATGTPPAVPAPAPAAPSGGAAGSPTPSLPAPAPPAAGASPATASPPSAPPPSAPPSAPSATAPAPTAPTPTAPPPTSPTPSATAPPTQPPAPQPAPAGAVVWEENFDRLDTSRWALEHSTYGDGNNELQCYRPDNVTVTGGRLVLRALAGTATCPNGATRNYTSGMVRSRGLRFEPGQALEFRVKLTPADASNQGGLWPAVWSSSWAGGGWPRGGELDYLEVMTATNPRRSIYSIHYARPDGSHGVTNREAFGTTNFSSDWHTVRFEYGQNGRLVWFLDGRQVQSVDGAQTIQGYPAPFDQAIGEIKINLALGGSPGPLDPRALGSGGATFEIDYIRVVRL